MNPKIPKAEQTNSIFTFALVTALYVFLASSLTLWKSDGLKILSSMSMGLSVSFLIFLISWVLNRLNFRSLRIVPLVFCNGILLFFFSDWLCRGYNLLQGPSIRGEIMLGALCAWPLVRRGAHSWFWVLLPISVLTFSSLFFIESGGKFLFSDDHATFFYRLTLLQQNFPHIPFYGPLWNAGIDVRDFFATGSLGIYFLFYPLIAWFPVESAYNLIIVHLLFVVAPAAAVIAARLEKLDWKYASLTGVLCLTSSLLWYRWALKYGTIGFALSTILVPLNISLAIRIISPNVVIELWQAALFICTFTLMLFWSPSGLVFLPIILIALFRAATRSLPIFRKRYLPLILSSILILNLPWIAAFWSVSKVGSFVSAEKAPHEVMNSESPTQPLQNFRHKASGFDPKRSIQLIRDAAISTNPLLIIMIIPGLLLIPARSRKPMALTLAWLLFLGCVVPTLKPQFEFDRMLLMLVFCGLVPATYALRHLFENYAYNIFTRLSACVSAGVLFASVFSVSGIIRNRSVEHYYFAPPLLEEMSAAVAAHAKGGRVLFSGFVLHELGQGHLAPLTYFSGQPLMASSHVHNLWRYKQIFPEEYIGRGDDGINQYLDLFNVSAVFAHEREWKEYFSARPQLFREVWRADRFVLFERLNFVNNYFYKGGGEILTQSSNKIVLKSASPDSVLKFNYLPFLKSSACQIAPQNVSPSVTLISLKDCPIDGEVVIEAEGLLKRMLGRS